MYDGISQAEGDRLRTGDPGAPAWHILCNYTEQTTGLPRQHVLAVAQERVAAAVECHIVWVTSCHAHTCTGGLAAVPAALLTHTAGMNEVKLR